MMDSREAVRQAIRRNTVIAVGEDEAEEIGDLEVAEYVIFLLSLEVYVRYVEEATGEEDPVDSVIRKGLGVLRIANAEAERIGQFLDENLPEDWERISRDGPGSEPSPTSPNARPRRSTPSSWH